ncbi:zinc-finger domain-containing protein [Insolitispirillum peregrinum]|uniref:Uncharacterized conserved protein, contains Zn-finger domain n=1 Tax=Insolitispirillum peregrinum TaxID=80876 RepID=A0A1N7JAN3_9PROT|nr:zinc-finger domain-containing protein [Insolitispirillum peregrinum]SIS46422.1 Uncharacterized conserved protein, contains Zn-finger domain [Insolitispirillum peregrinum]
MSQAATTPVQEVIEVEALEVSCDGGTPALGHPKVYLHVDAEDGVVCPYCSRHFVLKPGAKISAAH